MIIEFSIVIAAIVVSIAGSITLVARDGYRQVPTRRV